MTSAKFDWDSFEEVSSPGKDFDFSQFEEVKEPISKTKSILSAYPKGLAKGAEELSRMQDPIGSTLANILGKGKDLFGEISERVLPTNEGRHEQILERAGKLTPLVAAGPESFLAKLSQLLGGTAGGEIAKAFGGGELAQGIGEGIGFSVPGLAKGASQGVKRILGKGAVEKTPSGLTKLKATESNNTLRGIISPERKKLTIKKLDEEAAKLAQKSLKKHLPITEQIKKGIDLSEEFKKGFSELKKPIEKYNPTVDVKPLSKFLNEQVEKYKGIPNPHPDAVKIIKEIKGMRKRPITDMKDLYRIFRSNNKKRSSIFETSRITGKQKEYVDFLSSMNQKIAESFEETLPKDSTWLKDFKTLNKNYSETQKAKEVLRKLDPLLRGKASPASLEKLAHNPDSLKYLELKLGKEGAKDIMQLSKDLSEAKEAIKNIPARKLRAFEAILPLGIFIPGIKIPTGIYGAKKAYDLGRRAYGYLLTTPKGRKQYFRIIDAIVKGNVQEYKKLTDAIGKTSDED